MLKKTEVYDVTVTLNDGREMNCLLLSKPDALTLVAIAEAERATVALTEAMAFVREVTVSKDTDTTEIFVAGTLIGHVTVITLPAYLATKERGPKTKPIAAEVVPNDETSA